MQTRELHETWHIWLDTSEQLQRTLHELTVAITLRDSERIERLRSDADQMRRRLREIDEDIVAATENIAKSIGAENTVRGIAARLEKLEAQSFNGLANQVTVAGRTIKYLLEKNNALFQCRYAVVNAEEELAVSKAA